MNNIQKAPEAQIYNGHLIDDVMSSKKEINGFIYELPFPYNKLFHFACRQDDIASGSGNPFIGFDDSEEDAAIRQGLKFIFFLVPNTPEFEDWLTSRDIYGGVSLLENAATGEADLYVYGDGGYGRNAELSLLTDCVDFDELVAWADGNYTGE